MARKSKNTVVAERMKERMNALSSKIKEQNPEPFGVTQLSPAEFRKKATTDADFRRSMSRQMGDGLFLEMMNGEPDGN